MTGYLLALAAVIPVTGWAARRFGAKRVYLTSLVLFTAGSAALRGVGSHDRRWCSSACCRASGGGMIMPVGQLIMAQVAGPKRMGRVMGVVSMPAMLAPILGPVVGGMILQNLHWSWIFFVNVPIGVVAFVLGWRMLPADRLGRGGPPRRARAGAALRRRGGDRLRPQRSSAPAPASARAGVLGADDRRRWRWCAPSAGTRCASSARCSTSGCTRNRVFAGGSLTTFGLGAALFGAMILVPLYYQEVRRESVIATGLLNGPQGLGALIAMPLAGRLTERFGGGRMALLGVSVLCLSTLPLAFVGAHTSIAR